MIGQTISHYKVLSKLGEGGMGVVYKAEDLKLHRFVALKFLPAHVSDEDTTQRFVNEAHAVSALDHPNICAIYEIDQTPEGQMFIVMPCYEGASLQALVQKGPLDLSQAVEIASQVAKGLAKAHEKGIVHRDVKPGNILVTSDGLPKVVDFGLAKLATQTRLTRAGTTVGTVMYMSPEQARGEETDERSDIWSLGVVLYEMVTGRPPFTGEHEQAIIYSILNTPAEPLGRLKPGVPKELERIMAKALAKSPADRYQQMTEFAADLDALKETLRKEAKAQPVPRRGVSRRRMWIAFGVLVGAVVVAALLAKSYLSKPQEKPITSIAVLPFQNLSADPEQEYFSDGTTEALIAELSKIKALRVISRTSVMRFKKSDQSLPEIARQLNVDALVEGSVQRVEDEVRVTAQLVQAAPEKHMWANTYTETYRNILALESSIAQAIAREIRITMTPDEKERLAASRPVNPAAHEAYLKGRFHVFKWNVPDVEKGLEYLEQAIAIDSTYAAAYVGLAWAYDYFLAISPPQESAYKVNMYARKALSIDPTIAEAYALLADVKLVYDWDWRGAEANYQKAIALNPNDPIARGLYGQYLTVVGRADEGLQETLRAMKLNPLDLTVSLWLVNKHFYRREYDKSEALIREIQSMDSTYVLCYSALGRIRFAQGKYDEAVSLYRKALALGDVGLGTEGFAAALARSGQTSKAREVLADLIRQSESGYQTQVAVAAAYLALGEPDSSLYWLDKAYELRDGNLPWVRLMPMFDGLRSDPRYVALMRKMGLEP
jgi:serine/threonine-protein kinase